MKKVYLLLLSFAFLCSLSSFANSPCDSEMKMQPKTQTSVPCQKPCQKSSKKPCEKPSPQAYVKPCSSECFLCTNKNMKTLFTQMRLSDTQICTAMKIQDKYELEVLSLNERLECEETNLCQLKQSCAKRSQINKVKKTIKNLKKKRKEICKCYEKQFKALLSDQQKKAYRKYKKC